MPQLRNSTSAPGHPFEGTENALSYELGAPRPPYPGAQVVGEEVAPNGSSPSNHRGDEHLVFAVARGERLAMAALYDRYAPLLLAVATRILGNRVQAEDLLHDVLLEAWHRAGEYDPARGTVRAWLVTRVRSRALDERMGAARRAELVRTKLVGDEGSSRVPEIYTVDGHHVRREVAGLPHELEVVIDLAYFEGLSAAEIGVELGIPSGTVKSRIARAMALLRRHFLNEAAGVT